MALSIPLLKFHYKIEKKEREEEEEIEREGHGQGMVEWVTIACRFWGRIRAAKERAMLAQHHHRGHLILMEAVLGPMFIEET